MSFFMLIKLGEPSKQLKTQSSTILNLSSSIWNLIKHDEMRLCKFRWNLRERTQNKQRSHEFRSILKIFKDMRSKNEMKNCKDNEKLWKILKRELFKLKQRGKPICLNRKKNIIERKTKYYKLFNNENRSFKKKETNFTSILRKSACPLDSTTYIK